MEWRIPPRPERRDPRPTLTEILRAAEALGIEFSTIPYKVIRNG